MNLPVTSLLWGEIYKKIHKNKMLKLPTFLKYILASSSRNEYKERHSRTESFVFIWLLRNYSVGKYLKFCMKDWDVYTFSLGMEEMHECSSSKKYDHIQIYDRYTTFNIYTDMKTHTYAHSRQNMPFVEIMKLLKYAFSNRL